jgi:aminoglycoside N3'-acetyltransferase
VIVTAADVSRAVVGAGLAGRAVCLHSSLRSFGDVEGGAASVIVGFLAVDCTLLVPTFSWDAFAVSPPPPNLRPRRNGITYEPLPVRDTRQAFDTSSQVIDEGMGAVPKEVLAMPVRHRGLHPLCSFTGVGPLAADLVASQSPVDVFAPLDALVSAGGAVVLAGVGLTSMTLLHVAEQRAGRAMFVRAARVAGAGIVGVRTGGCSTGFENLRPALDPFETTATVGTSRWRMFDAAAAVDAATYAIRRDRRITRCHNEVCERCDDAIAGGPIAPLTLR